MERVVELERWRGDSETEMTDNRREVRESLQEMTGNLHIVNNHAMLLDYVVLGHHPESYRDLGYSLNEDASSVGDTTTTPTEETPEEPSRHPVSVELEGSGSSVLLP